MTLLGSTLPVPLLGYHENHELPVKKGDTVIIPKGTAVKTVGHPTKPAGRTYRIVVHHILNGQNRPEGDPRHVPTYPVMNPRVVWPGPGGYWSEADINDVRLASGDGKA